MTPRLTALMVVMSLVGAGGPIAAMAQDREGATDDNDAILLDICEENQRNEQTDIVELTPGLVLSEIEITFEADSDAEADCDELEGKILEVPVVIRRPPAL